MLTEHVYPNYSTNDYNVCIICTLSIFFIYHKQESCLKAVSLATLLSSLGDNLSHTLVWVKFHECDEIDYCMQSIIFPKNCFRHKKQNLNLLWLDLVSNKLYILFDTTTICVILVSCFSEFMIF